MPVRTIAALAFLAAAFAAHAQPAAPTTNPAYDPSLVKSYGGDDNGMRGYVLVVLKSSTTPVPKGSERDEMFKGHFANINRRADEGKLVMAGPLDGADGWRGMFIFAVTSIDEAKTLVATDPVVIKGEMVPEYHTLYSTAGLMAIPEMHKKLVKPR